MKCDNRINQRAAKSDRQSLSDRNRMNGTRLPDLADHPCQNNAHKKSACGAEGGKVVGETTFSGLSPQAAEGVKNIFSVLGYCGIVPYAAFSYATLTDSIQKQLGHILQHDLGHFASFKAFSISC